MRWLRTNDYSPTGYTIQYQNQLKACKTKVAGFFVSRRTAKYSISHIIDIKDGSIVLLNEEGLRNLIY